MLWFNLAKKSSSLKHYDTLFMKRENCRHGTSMAFLKLINYRWLCLPKIKNSLFSHWKCPNMYNFLFFPMKVSSIKLPEETCKPRPVVVSVTQDYRPYHITVYRCSGTCDANIPPSQKPCTAAKKKEIEVEFTGPLGQHHKTIKIYNHTSCSCECNLECNWAEGERLDGDNCRCLKGPSTDRFVGGQKTGVMP